MRTLIIYLFCHFSIKAFSQTTYTFTGNGNWSVATNWSNNTIPPNPLPDGSIIYITPSPGDSCVLDVSQTISPGANLIIGAGANFVLSGGVVINNNLPSQPGIAICDQVWMTKNLTVSSYRNGDPIPEVTDFNQWQNLTTGAWCWYNNDSANYSVYGKLYNWYAVNDPRGLAPAGWRIPTNEEINKLVACFGDAMTIGGLFKEAGTARWQAPNAGSTNTTGFTALPAGYRSGGTFFETGRAASFWKSSEYDNNSANTYAFFSFDSAFYKFGLASKTYGFSVRCFKDTVVNNASLPVLTTSEISFITNSTAVCGGSITSDGGYPITAKGVVWDTLPNPVVSDNQTRDGSGTGSFTSNLSSLSGSKTYYVRAYARNQLGNGYGNEISFRTLAVLPASVSTLPVVFFKDTMAFGQGSVSDFGGGRLTDMGVVMSTNPNPSFADIRASMSGGNYDSFYARFGSLLPNTVYYVKAYAVNEAGVSYGNEISFTTAALSPGNVIVSNQVWALKDLSTTTYRNGDPIPQVTEASEWASLTTGAWCWYNNDSATYASTYGRIYNGYAITDPRGLAPAGWHLPSDSEWNTLAVTLGGFAIAGSKLKDTTSSLWPSPNFNTNESGFTALPNGFRTPTGSFAGLIYSGNWWSSGNTSGEPNRYYLSYVEQMLGVLNLPSKNFGLSVRCIKD